MLKAVDMDYFMDEAAERVREQLGGDYEVTCDVFQKNNGVSLRGLIISDRTGAASPCIYMEGYYAAYSEKGDMELIVKDIICTYEKNRSHDFQPDLIRDREQALDSVLFRLVNTEKNKRLLKGVPHNDLHGMGLTMVFYLLLQTGENCRSASVLVTDRLMEMWDSSETELLEHARRNTPLKMEYSVCSMQSILGGYPETKAGKENCLQQIYVLTNRNALYGAGCIMYDGLLEKLADDMESGFYILPSSIHEVILCRASVYNQAEAAVLKEMVTEINRTELLEEEILMDAVYYFDRETKELLFSF